MAVQDKSTIVLGGLITADEEGVDDQDAVPGRHPVLRPALQEPERTTRQRTELIIFIRPDVMRSDLAAVAEAKRRLRMLGVSEELEETYFPKGSSGTNNAALPPKGLYRFDGAGPTQPGGLATE